MQVEKLLNVGGCCCFDLKTGALIIGYISLAFSVLCTMPGFSDPVSFYFLLTCAFTAMDMGFVYGIHKNQRKYMLVSVLWSLIMVIFCIGFLIVWLMGILLFNDFMVKFKPWFPHTTDSHTASTSFFGQADMHGRISSGGDTDATMSAITGIANGLLWFLWIGFAFGTWVDFYFAKVKYSMYRAMKSSSSAAAPGQFQPCGMSSVNFA